MASNPPGHCCTTGVEHDGTPVGRVINIDGHDAYLAVPSDGAARKDAGILYVPDVLGIWQNSRVLADKFALHGYTTLIIDLFKGDALSLDNLAGINVQEWIQKGSTGDKPHTVNEIDPIVVKAISYMRNSLRIKHVGGVGYCFGAKYVVRHYASGIEAGFIAHPSFVEKEELAAISGPLSLAAAEVDKIFTTELRQESEDILRATGQPHQITLYSGVNHGFAVRLEQEKKVERVAAKLAMLQALSFFDEWLVD